ncbi:MAG: hypothetical protein AAFR31_20225 [Cyanobacteria bacterium J06627_8]
MNRTLRLPQLLTAVTRVCMVMLLVVMLTFSDFARLSAWAQEPPPRAIASFDLSADWTEPDQFYDFPYPSDLRLDPNKHPDLSGFPVFTKFYGFFKRLKTIASDRLYFPTTAAGYFRFDQPLANQDPTQLIEAATDSPILLIDVDRESPERGKLFPVVASTPAPDPYYVPPHLLGVAPYPGIVLQPNRQYAYVVRRGVKDRNGKSIKPTPAFRQLRRGEIPRGPMQRKFLAYLLYKPLWETLDQLDVERNSVVTATVFTTGDVVTQTAQLSDAVLARYDRDFKNLRYEPDNRISGLNYCKFVADIRLPQFQKGTPPFLFFEKRAGLFELDANGKLKQKGNDTVPVVITVPKKPMPRKGYPLMMYYHGSGGLSSQVTDRGPVIKEEQGRIPGRGPADVVARYGFASVGAALPLNPERIPVVVSNIFGNRPYLNPTNPSAYRDTFRQGVFEQRLIIEALDRLTIPPEALQDCQGPSLPNGATSFRIDTTSMVALGQSQGAQYAAMMGAVEPKITSVIPTGSGGFWALLFATFTNQEGGDFEKIAAVLDNVLKKEDAIDHLYPPLRLLQSSWEAAEPMVYMPRIAKRPLPGHPVRSVYQPVGQGDSAFPEVIFDAVALATGIEQAGDELWPEMQESLAIEGYDGLIDYPVSDNLKSDDGRPYTGVVVQYAGDGLADPHTIFSQLDDVKSQYGCFMDSVQKTGNATVPRPKPVDLPCNFP